MSNHTYNEYIHMSDSSGRGLTHNVLRAGPTTSVVASVFSAIKKGAVALFDYMVDVTEAMNEARLRDPRYSRTRW
jgi:hypothetical protein